MTVTIGQRELLATLGGAAAAWPLAARAQERMRRVGILSNLAESDPGGQVRLTVLVQKLKELGWGAGWSAMGARHRRGLC